MLASVCMSAYNARPSLKRVLASIEAQEPGFDFEVVVVDDGSDKKCDAVCAEFPRVRYHWLGERPYYCNPAAGFNEAVLHARGEVIVYQSCDILHETDAVRQLVRTVLAEEKLAAFAKVWESDNSADLCSTTNPRPIFFLGALRRADFVAFGGMDEDFIDFGFEDNWLAQCMQHNGMKFAFRDDIRGVHLSHSRDQQPGRPHYHESQKLFSAKCSAAVFKANKSRLYKAD